MLYAQLAYIRMFLLLVNGGDFDIVAVSLSCLLLIQCWTYPYLICLDLVKDVGFLVNTQLVIASRFGSVSLPYER